MKKSQMWLVIAVCASSTGMILQTFTTIPDYISNLSWLVFAICVWLALRARKGVPVAAVPSTPPQNRNKRFAILVLAVTLGLIAGSFLTQREHLGLSLATQVTTWVTTYVAIVAFMYWRIYKRPAQPPQLTKGWIIALVALFLCFGFAEWFAVFDRDAAATDKVQRELNYTIAEWQKLPPGIERVEDLVRRLRRIDISHAPADVQKALQDYADAMDRGLTTLKAGVNTDAADREIAERKTTLDQALRKH